MNLTDLGSYLFAGDREAIKRLATSPASLPVGALLVISASIARNHDGAWLIAEWPNLTHGLVVSTINALVLYSLFFAMATVKKLSRPSFAGGLVPFLALFWLTSPMAWLYAIPYEHMMPAESAIRFNAWTLAGVSLWRVALIAQVMSVLWGFSWWVALGPVLFFSNVVVLIGVFTMPVPLVDFMGGLQHANPMDSAIASMHLVVRVLGVMALPATIAIAIVSLNFLSGGWTLAEPSSESQRWVPSAGVIAMLIGVALAAGLLLASFQPDQARRHEATRLLREDFAEGFAYMSRFERTDFPPIWDPPPRLGYRETTPSVDAIRAELAKDQGAPWARAIFLEKSWSMLMTQARSRTWRFDSDPRPRLKELDWYMEQGRSTPHENALLIASLRFHVEHDERMHSEHRDKIRRWLDAMDPRERDEAKASEESSRPTPASPPPPP
jgi:hypothetical protein